MIIDALSALLKDKCILMTRPAVTYVSHRSHLIENHFQVTPSFRNLKNMPAQVGVAFKVSEGGLRNAALHPGSCVTLVC